MMVVSLNETKKWLDLFVFKYFVVFLDCPGKVNTFEKNYIRAKPGLCHKLIVGLVHYSRTTFMWSAFPIQSTVNKQCFYLDIGLTQYVCSAQTICQRASSIYNFLYFLSLS